MEAETYIDPKGSASLTVRMKSTLSELMQGRIAYGEWMKHLFISAPLILRKMLTLGLL